METGTQAKFNNMHRGKSSRHYHNRSRFMIIFLMDGINTQFVVVTVIVYVFNSICFRICRHNHCYEWLDNDHTYAVEFDLLLFTYSLYATSNHGNSRTVGRYTSYVKSPQNVWYHKDDSKVSVTSQSHLLSQTSAYILPHKFNILKKNSKAFNYNEAKIKTQVGEHVKFCMFCRDDLSNNTCNKNDHSYCISEMNVQDDF